MKLELERVAKTSPDKFDTTLSEWVIAVSTVDRVPTNLLVLLPCSAH